MNLYQFFLYLHILGAMGYAAGAILSLLGLFALRRTQQVGQASSGIDLVERSGQISGISLLIILLAGIFMTVTSWGWKTAWIDVTLGTFVLLLVFGALMGIRRHRIAVMLKGLPDGELPRSAEQQFYDPLLGLGTYMLVTLLLGIVFLMTVKPGLAGSLITIGVALVLGFGISLPNWNRAKQVSEGTANRIS